MDVVGGGRPLHNLRHVLAVDQAPHCLDDLSPELPARDPVPVLRYPHHVTGAVPLGVCLAVLRHSKPRRVMDSRPGSPRACHTQGHHSVRGGAGALLHRRSLWFSPMNKNKLCFKY